MRKPKLLAGVIAGLFATTSLALVAPPASAAVFTFSNNTPITIDPPTGDVTPLNGTSITQFGMSTVITDVNVTISGLNHTFPDDLDIELIGPDGTAVALMSDVCGGTDISGTYTFDDSAAAPMPDSGPCAPGAYEPGNADNGTDAWSVTPTLTNLAGFNGKRPNGTWRLWVDDDGTPDGGGLAGWSITITTATTAPITVPALGTNGSGVASPYPVPIPVTGTTGPVTDVDVHLKGVAHTYPDDLDVLVVSPAGAKVMLMSDSCGPTDLLNVDLTFDDAAAAPLSNGGPCLAGAFKPTDNDVGETLPGPAPAGPYATSLAAFNGAAANGTWLLYVTDDTGTDGGWLGALPTLTIKTADVIAPNASLVGKKQTNTTKTKAKIKFTSNEAGSTFRCKVDAKRYKPCTSPLKLKNLKVGKHKVLVRATDPAGNVDPTPLKVKWRIFPEN